MSDERLRRLLQSAAPPGELDAERRAWSVVRAAYDPAAAARSRGRPTRLLIALAAALALIAASLSPPGRAVAGWVRDAIGRERVEGREDARPALASLPAPGRLLVVSARGTWVVNEDGSKRRLGGYGDASWSPHGLHVVLVRGPRLVAATPTGEIRWTLTRRPRIVAPRWSPSGYRIAYGVGGRLRLVNGDGAPDRGIGFAVPGSWAWRPDADRNVLAFVTQQGVVRVLDVDTRELLWSWRHRAAHGVHELAWSADGRRLVAHDDDTLWVLDDRGRRLASRRVGPIQSLAVAPRGHALAIAARNPPARSRVVVLDAERRLRPREVFRGDGRLAGLGWAPDGRWLLVTWPSADQWLFLRMPGVREIRAVSDIEREFDPGGGEAGPAPRPAGWCCPPAG